MSRKKPAEDDEIMAPGWVVTYGDLMSLLLVFFVLIVSFSTTERIKFRKAMGSLKGGTSFLEPNSGTSPVSMDEVMNVDRNLETSISELTELLEEMELESSVDYYRDEKGVRFVLKSPVLFDEARAELKPEIAPVLDQIALIISRYPHERVIIEGHTDDTPIMTDLYPSNWELSSARSMAVLKYYFNRNLIPPENLSSMGYGEFHPIVPNTTASNKARNRRVEVFIEKADVQLPRELPSASSIVSPQEKTAP